MTCPQLAHFCFITFSFSLLFMLISTPKTLYATTRIHRRTITTAIDTDIWACTLARPTGLQGYQKTAYPFSDTKQHPWQTVTKQRRVVFLRKGPSSASKAHRGFFCNKFVITQWRWEGCLEVPFYLFQWRLPSIFWQSCFKRATRRFFHNAQSKQCGVSFAFLGVLGSWFFMGKLVMGARRASEGADRDIPKIIWKSVDKQKSLWGAKSSKHWHAFITLIIVVSFRLVSMQSDRGSIADLQRWFRM